MSLVKRLTLIVVSAASLAACRSNSLEVESTGAWSGTLQEGNDPKYPISGTGNLSMDMKTNNFCWTIFKQTDPGHLRVYAKIHSWISTDRGGDKDTYLPYGGVMGCSTEP